jgi:hypothetical protein
MRSIQHENLLMFNALTVAVALQRSTPQGGRIPTRIEHGAPKRLSDQG